MYRAGILGAGTWGTALGRLLCINGNEVTIWSAIEREVTEFSSSRRHPNLPGMVIPKAVRFTTDISEASTDKDIIIFAVPSVYTRNTAKSAAKYIPEGQIIVDVAKGIEPETLSTLTEVIRHEIKKAKPGINVRLAALSGPSHAEEVALDMPTTIVSACEDMETAKFVQDVFMNTCMRVYTNPDVKGVELCGAMKNIVALAAGISAGLGYGDNAKAAIITRGIAEIRRLGVAMGCMERTFNGLAGIGDLIVTATSIHSRNNKAGTLIGKGYSPAQAVKEVGMVVEGMNALPAAMILSRRYKVELPIIEAVNRIVNENARPAEAVANLMSREKKNEMSKSESELLENKQADVKRVLICGEFDRLDYNDLGLLRRAKAMGDYLVVALSQGSKKCLLSYNERKTLLEAVRYVDLVVEDDGREIGHIITEYNIDVLAVTAGDNTKNIKGEKIAVIET